MVQWLNELAAEGVFVTDTELVIRRCNVWLARATGRDESAIVDQPLLNVFPEIGARGLDRYYRAALDGQVSVLAHRFHRHLVTIRNASGEMLQSTRIAPLTDNGKVIGTITVIEDVSERVNSELELRRQIAAAEQARETAESALRIKDDFLATLSHELRTPLNAVLGWTNILLSQKNDGPTRIDPEMLQRALRVIDRNATAQARLIDDMLDMARIATGKLRLEMGPVDLLAATLAALDVVAPSAAAKGITIHRALGTRTQPILADSDRVQQIAWNVLANAVKFTPKGGSIGVRIQQDDTSTRLIVTDSGKGIEADFLPHVFERFRQANSSVNRTEGGLGLGLALVQQLVEMHGGTITVSSAGAGHGSTFIITFPAVSDEALPLDSPLSATPAVLASRHVLVVDDEEDWRDLLKQTLQAHGASVVTAGSTPEALQLLKGRDVRLPDAIIADIGLPGEDGFSLIQTIRSASSASRHIPAIAVTAYAGADKRRAALDAGFDSYRAKPISPDAVVTAVVELLKGDQGSDVA